MYNLFSVCRTRAGEMRSDDDEFVVARQDAAGMARVRALKEQGAALRKKIMPVRLTALIIIFMVAGMVSVTAYFEIASETGFAEAWRNVRWLIAAGVPLLALTALLLFFFVRRVRRIMASPAVREYLERAERETIALKEALGVPADASALDVIAYVYREGRQKKPISATGRFLTRSHTLLEYNVFVRGDRLCFADAERVVGVPLSMLVATYPRRKRVIVDDWNKSEPATSKQYKKFASSASDGSTVIRSYLALHLAGSRGEYEIWIPAYEAETLQRVVDLKLIAS